MKKGAIIPTAFLSAFLILSPSVNNKIILNTGSEGEIDNDRIPELSLIKRDHISLMVDTINIKEKNIRLQRKLSNLQKKEYKTIPYDMGMCRKRTFNSISKIRIIAN